MAHSIWARRWERWMYFSTEHLILINLRMFISSRWLKVIIQIHPKSMSFCKKKPFLEWARSKNFSPRKNRKVLIKVTKVLRKRNLNFNTVQIDQNLVLKNQNLQTSLWLKMIVWMMIIITSSKITRLLRIWVAE